MAVVIKGSGSIEGTSGLEMGANGATEIRGKVNVGLGSSVAGDSYTTGISTASNFTPSSVPTSHRNLIINGAMNVAQRGTSDTSDTQGRTTVDRWSVVWSGLEEELSRYQESLSSSDTGPWEKGFRNAWKIQNGNQTGGADASGYINPQYTVEAQDLASSGWNPADPTSKLTLSFWVKSSVAQTFYSYLYVEDGGGDSYAFSYALRANTWTKVTKTIPGHADLAVNNDNGGGMTIYLPLFLGTDRTTSGHTLNQWQSWSGSNRTPDQTTTWYTTNDATWHMTGIQLEVGSVATPFEHRSYGDELLRCQRYYWRKIGTQWAHAAFGLMASTTQVRAFVQFPVTMRAAPTLSGSGMYVDSETTGTFDITAFTSTYLYNSGGQARMTTDTASFGAGTAVNIGLESTTAYFAGDAEF